MPTATLSIDIKQGIEVARPGPGPKFDVPLLTYLMSGVTWLSVCRDN